MSTGMSETFRLAAPIVAALACSIAVAQTSNEPQPVKLLSARPSKLLYDVGERVVSQVAITNLTATTQVVTVSAWLEWELDAKSRVQSTECRLEPKGGANLPFTWKETPVQYGYAFKAEVRQGDRLLAQGEDYFQISDRYWKVALISAVGFLWNQFDDFKPKATLQWADEIVGGLRREYYNGFEHFFWGEDDFLGLTPEREIWYSGQARYQETKTGLKGLIARAHEHGIQAITYAKLTGGGPVGVETARRHPEWVWISGGTLSIDRNARAIAEWDRDVKDWRNGSWVPVNYNMNDPRVVDIGIKSLSDTAAMFGWDGARWDGNFDVAGTTYDLEGKVVEQLTAEQRDARNADNMRRAKERISKKHPRFVYGYNWTQGNWDQSMATSPLESTELCRDGGLIMNEYINQAEGVQHPLHRWEVYAPSVANDVDKIKKLGGYYGPILSSQPTADGKYTLIFAYAAGAHPYYHHLWGDFMTRYSAFCWDTALTRLPDVEKRVQVSGGAWWKHWVFERPIDSAHKQLIVHLINPPAHPTVGEGKKAEDVPAPLKNVTVTLLPESVSGWRVKRATRLSAEPRLQEPIAVQAAGRGATLTVPELALWNIVIVDLEK